MISHVQVCEMRRLKRGGTTFDQLKRVWIERASQIIFVMTGAPGSRDRHGTQHSRENSHPGSPVHRDKYLIECTCGRSTFPNQHALTIRSRCRRTILLRDCRLVDLTI
jgi:hypothetical protein